MTAKTLKTTRATIQRDVRRVRPLMSEPDIRVFIPRNAREGGVFRARKGRTDLVTRLPMEGVEVFLGEGALLSVRETKSGSLYRAVPPKDRVRPPLTARARRNTAWNTADRAFLPLPSSRASGATPSMAESPIGWLARRRGADGKPFLSRGEIAAAERLRIDFERSQLAPGVAQDWQRFLTSGVEGGKRCSAQERDIEGGAQAARERLSEALDALGPSLSDVALRVCCFLQGIEAVETSMQWSRRSGKVVLKIALQRLADFYDRTSVRDSAAIETWRAGKEVLDQPNP